MVISDLIDELQEAKRKYGNVDVYVLDGEVAKDTTYLWLKDVLDIKHPSDLDVENQYDEGIVLL